MGWLSRLFHRPAPVDEGIVYRDPFAVPFEEPPAPRTEEAIAVEVEPESKAATVKAAVKKRVAPKKPVKKKAKK